MYTPKTLNGSNTNDLHLHATCFSEQYLALPNQHAFARLDIDLER